MKKFILSSTDFKKALTRLANVIPVKHTLPAVTNIYCKVGDKSVELIGSDTETTIILKLAAETGDETFEFLMPFQLVQKIVALSGSTPMSFTMDKNKVKITTEADAYELKNLQKVEIYPQLPEVPKKNSIDITSEVVKLMKVASLTVTKDESKPPALTKVLLELRKDAVTVASADGSFMIFSHTLKDLTSDDEEDLLISPKVIKSIEDIDQAKVTWHKKTISLEGENITVLITRPEGVFPPYRKMFPEDWPSNLTLNRSELLVALEKCNLSSDYFKIMKIDLSKKGKVLFHANDKTLGIDIKVEVSGTYTGSVKSVSASSEKMHKLMTQIDYDNVELAIHDEARPIVFRNEDSGYHGLLLVQHPSVG